LLAGGVRAGAVRVGEYAAERGLEVGGAAGVAGQ
jgi:hypothetical protein